MESSESSASLQEGDKGVLVELLQLEAWRSGRILISVHFPKNIIFLFKGNLPQLDIFFVPGGLSKWSSLKVPKKGEVFDRPPMEKGAVRGGLGNCLSQISILSARKGAEVEEVQKVVL